jgi:integrase
LASRSRNGSGTIQERKDGRFEARLTVDGRIKSFYGRTWDEADKKLQEARASRRKGLPVIATGRQTVGDYFDEWHAERSYNSHSTRTQYGWAIDHIKEVIGKERLTALTIKQVETLLRKKQAAGLSTRSVQLLRQVLSAALNDAIRHERLSRNVAELAKAPQVVSRQPQVLSLPQQRSLLETVKADRLEALYGVMLFCGLRVGEALALSWTDIDFSRATLTVTHNLARTEAGWRRISRTKTGVGRTIRLAAPLVEVLQQHRIAQLAEQRALGDAWRNDYNLCFTTVVGTPIDQRNLSREFHRNLERAGLPRMGLHSLRHSAATLALATGDSYKTVQGILGHSRPSVTLNTYAHAVAELQDESAARRGSLLFPERL